MEQRILTPLQQKFITKLLPYNYEVQYKRGRENAAADALSRIPEGSITMHAILTITSPLVQEIRESIDQDLSLQKLIQEKTADATSHPAYLITNQGLQRKGKWVVGNHRDLRARIIREIHDGPSGGHSGRDAMRKRISRFCYWRGQTRDIDQYIRECDVCQRNKGDNRAYPGLLQPLPIPQQVWTSISMDFIESLPKSEGKEVILVVVDRLSKYAHFLGLHHPYTASSVAKVFLEQVYKLHGMPNDIVSD